MKSNLDLLRIYMREENVSAVVLPTADSHLSEYIPECYKLRQWLCGFTGSSGDLVVTMNKSGLWTDGRYYIQAELELRKTETVLYRLGEKDCISINDFLKAELNSGDCVAFDGRLFSKKELDGTTDTLKKVGISINTDFDAFKIWKNRPLKPMEKVFKLPSEYICRTAEEKIQNIRSLMKKDGFTHYLIAMPECIMWLLDIRGNDILHNPVALSYMILSKDNITLYIDSDKVDNVKDYLAENNVEIREYDSVYGDLSKIKEGYMAVDFNYTNYNLIKSIKCAYRDTGDFILYTKCIKSDQEIENIKRAYIKENTALVKSFYEIYHSEELNEFNVSEIIEKHREDQPGYFLPSFSSIVAYGKNGAIVHYSPDRENCEKIQKKSLLLIDAGGQYFDGTTDTTRTLVMGDVTDEEKECFTLVLKSNIRLATTVFPKGKTGRDIDSIAREPLWKHGFDYNHGTGHGIGYFLSVHEGPQRISPRCDEKIAINMTFSDEPGVYIRDKFGIRIENHLCVREFSKTDSNTFLCFEVLNYCPIGTEGIVTELLDKDEITWINSYNKKCVKLLKPNLTEDEYSWLTEFVKAI